MHRFILSADMNLLVNPVAIMSLTSCQPRYGAVPIDFKEPTLYCSLLSPHSVQIDRLMENGTYRHQLQSITCFQFKWAYVNGRQEIGTLYPIFYLNAAAACTIKSLCTFAVNTSPIQFNLVFNHYKVCDRWQKWMFDDQAASAMPFLNTHTESYEGFRLKNNYINGASSKYIPLGCN